MVLTHDSAPAIVSWPAPRNATTWSTMHSLSISVDRPAVFEDTSMDMKSFCLVGLEDPENSSLEGLDSDTKCSSRT